MIFSTKSVLFQTNRCWKSTAFKGVKATALALAVVFNIQVSAQNPAVGTHAYNEAKMAGTLVQPSLALPYNGAAPNVSQYIIAAENRSSDCWVAHDPATWTNFPGNDDGSTAVINLPFTFDLYGASYNSLYINNNGNITFNNPLSSFTPDGFPISTPMIAPFWGDVDTRNGLGEVWYIVTPEALYVNWVNVGVFSAFAPENFSFRNTFQLIITNGGGTILEGNNNVAFHYLDMGWTTGDASGGDLGFGGAPATVGVNSGNNSDFIQIGRFDNDSDNYDGPFGANDGVNWLENQCFQFNVSSADNFPPIAQNVPANNTLTFCNDADGILNFNFIGPENGQTVTVTASADFDFVFNTVAGSPATVNADYKKLVVNK